MLIGEGLFGLTVVSDTTSPVFWTIELAAGIGVVVVTMTRHRLLLERQPRLALAAALVVAFSTGCVGSRDALNRRRRAR